jgi:hypothetical protein
LHSIFQNLALELVIGIATTGRSTTGTARASTGTTDKKYKSEEKPQTDVNPLHDSSLLRHGTTGSFAFCHHSTENLVAKRRSFPHLSYHSPPEKSIESNPCPAKVARLSTMLREAASPKWFNHFSFKSSQEKTRRCIRTQEAEE